MYYIAPGNENGSISKTLRNHTGNVSLPYSFFFMEMEGGFLMVMTFIFVVIIEQVLKKAVGSFNPTMPFTNM